MTKNEAIKKIYKAYDSTYGQGSVIKTIAALEALGLIKFDEEKTTMMNEVIEQARYFTSTTQEFIDRLNIGGYKIVKK